MVIDSFKKIWHTVIDLFLKRIVFLFLVGIILSTTFINQDRIKTKTLNTLIPKPDVLKKFVENPQQIDARQLKDIAIYYKTLCDFLADDAHEKPAPCGVLAYAYYYQGQKHKAIEQYKYVIKLNQNFFWYYYNLGVIYYNDENYPQATDYFYSAMKVYPYAMVFLSMSETYKSMSKSLRLKQPDTFQDNLEKALVRTRDLYVLSKVMSETPRLKTQIQRTEIDLKLF